jgi:hypothetical protein
MGGRGDSISLSAPRAERAEVRWGFRVVAVSHLTFPRLRRGPLPLPPEGRRGIPHRPDEMCALRRGSGCHAAGAHFKPRLPGLEVRDDLLTE